jgi:hypothetical protein
MVYLHIYLFSYLRICYFNYYTNLRQKDLCQFIIRRVALIWIHTGISMTVPIPGYNCLMMVFYDRNMC